MNVLRLSLLAALPLWLASCATGIDLIGDRQLESDEFYLAGGEPHTGDEAIDDARYGQWMDEVDEFNDGDFDDPYAGNYSGRSNSQLWNRYTPGWSSGLTSSFGNPYGYGNPYGSFGMGTGGFGNPYGMGHNNMAFMNGYDAWGNPIGGFGNSGFGYGNPYGMGGYGSNGWGYDPWGGGYWGTPGNGYFGGSGYGYHPYYGNLGAYGNGWCGNGTSGTGGGVITFTPPRPRPSLGQFTGESNGAGSGSGGQADGSFDGSGVSSGNQPAVSRATDRANADSKREQNRKLRAEQQQLRSEREAAERRALERQRQSRNSQRLAQQQRRETRKTERQDNGDNGNRSEHSAQPIRRTLDHLPHANSGIRRQGTTPALRVPAAGPPVRRNKTTAGPMPRAPQAAVQARAVVAGEADSPAVTS